MMGLLPIEPFFPEEKTGVGESEETEAAVNFQTEFDSKFGPRATTSSPLPGVFADSRVDLSPAGDTR